MFGVDAAVMEGLQLFARKRMGGFAEQGILFLVVVSLGVGMIVH